MRKTSPLFSEFGILIPERGLQSHSETESVAIDKRSLCTGILSNLGAKLRDWANGQAEAGCYSLAALPSNDLKNQ